MKKTLAILLAVLLSLSVVALVACSDKKITKIAVDGLPDEVELNDTEFYKNITITVTYDDDTTDTFAYNSEGVTLEGTDTSTKGAKILKVLYGGLSAEKTYTVVYAVINENITITNVANTEGYLDYSKNIQEQTNAEETFYDTERGYSVGTANGYWCLPEITFIDDDGNDGTLDNPITNFTLSENDVVLEDVTPFVSAEDNIYYFTEAAIGHTFTLTITLSDEYNLLTDKTNKTITQEITIVDGYNVHDVLDLSVLDNLNNNSWADIKTAVRPWNNGKTLAEFKDVNQVIIHNNITVKKDNLPSNYFWQKGETANGESGKSYDSIKNLIPENFSEDLLVGSIKETYLGEAWENGRHKAQRGLYVNNGIGINGNYLKLSYESGLVVAEDGTVTAPNGGIYVVYDYNQDEENRKDYPEVHTSFVSVRLDGSESYYSPVFENVYFVGQTNKTDNTNMPAGLMMMGGIEVDTTIDNVIANQWFCNLEMDGIGADRPSTTVNMKNCKFYDAFSQMVYSWYGRELNVINCELKRAGGPLFIMQCATDKETNPIATTLNIDSTANMESWLTGSETWFQINKLPASDIAQLLSLAGNLDAMGKHYIAQDGELTKCNLIAVMIPEPSKVFTNQHAVHAELNITTGIGGDAEYIKYGMNEDAFSAMLNLQSTAAKGAELGDKLANTMIGMNEDGTPIYVKQLVLKQKVDDQEIDVPVQSVLKQLIEGFEVMANNSALATLKLAPVFKSGSDYILFNGTDPKNIATLGETYDNDGNLTFAGLATNVKNLYDGVGKIITLLNDYAAQQSDMAETLGALVVAWTEVANGLKPLSNVVSDDAWKANWQANDYGYAVMWVNAGGLDANNPNLNIKHFAVLFGENTSK